MKASLLGPFLRNDGGNVAVIAALTELGEALRDSARAYSNADADARSTLHLAAS